MELVLPIKPHVNQHAILHPSARFNVIAAGRRFGKTESQKLRAIYMVMEGKNVWWLNPTFDNTYEAWLDFLAFFEQCTPRENINKSRRQIFAPTGGSIRMLGADNFKRGPGIHHLFVDEAAFLDLDNLWDYQIRPMLLDNAHSGATFLSSTNGRNGFWKLYQRGLDPEEKDWQSWHFTSYDNPLLDRNEIEDIRRNTPDRVFQQEYMAEFLDDGGAVFRNLKACTDDSIQIDREKNLYPPRRGRIVMGVDWARYNDYTVIYAIDTATHKVVDYDRFNQIDWTLQRARLMTMFHRWKPSVIYAEANSIGEPNIEELQKAHLPIQGFVTTTASKAQIINALALAFEQTDIKIPNEPVLLGELQAYTLERLPSGIFRYTAPPGLHDDCVMGLALAWYGITNEGISEYYEAPNIFGRD